MEYNIVDVNNYTKLAKFSFVDESLQERITNELKKMGKDVEIKGFRKGKVPFELISKLYRKDAGQKVFEDLVNQKIRSLVDEKKMALVGAPSLNSLDVNTENGQVVFDVTFEVFPEFELKDVKNYKVTTSTVTVTDTDISEFKQHVLKSEGKLINVDGKPLANDMIAVLNLKGFEGETSTDLSWEGRYYSIDNSAPFPELTACLIGKVKDDEFECTQIISDKFYKEELRGKQLTLKGTVKDVMEYELPEFNDKMVAAYGFESVEDFNNRIGQVLQFRKDEEIDRKFMNDFMDKLIPDNVFELPKSMINSAIERQMEQTKEMEKYYGKKTNHDLVKLEETAKQSLLAALMYSRLIDKYNITVEQSDIDSYLEKIKEVFGEKYLQENSTDDYKEKIKDTIISQKLITALKREFS